MVSSNITLDNDWYSKPLNSNDIIASGTLILLALIFLLIYILIVFVLYRESSVVRGFVYLLSASINNMILLINYALWPGILIIAKKRAPENGRRLYQIYFDTMWFSMCYHTLLVAWTRCAAVCRPCQFRKQKNSTIYISCLMCYVIAFVQSMILYFQPWYVTFYYETSVYGMIAEDIKLYLEGGKAQFFFIFHSLLFIATFIFYGLDNIQMKLKNCKLIRKQTKKWKWKGRDRMNLLKNYVKLILPCICNSIVFLIGQVVITVGIDKGRWTLWLILVLFTLTASVDSLTLLIFSKTVRYHDQLRFDINNNASLIDQKKKTLLAILREVFCSNRKTVVTELKKTRQPMFSPKTIIYLTKFLSIDARNDAKIDSNMAKNWDYEIKKLKHQTSKGAKLSRIF
uniref:Uncharacterized protein n=1 Tax=Onchocerca volvulus TaxID=6282 RepID=A0A8R1TMN7_ONCVO